MASNGRGEGDLHKEQGGAKASIRYIAYRPGKNREEMARQLFGHDGALSLTQADRIIDEAKKGTNFFRLVLSPDPKQEDRLKDLDMWEFARQLFSNLKADYKRKSSLSPRNTTTIHRSDMCM